MKTIDIELMDAALNAPAGLDGLAADMADLAQREPIDDRCAHPSSSAAADAIHAGPYRRRLQDARAIIERVNALADKWEQVGNGYVSQPKAACDLRRALAPDPRRHTPRRPKIRCR